MNILTIKMIEKIKNPYLVFDLNSKTTLLVNEKAKQLLSDSSDIINLEQIFDIDYIISNIKDSSVNEIFDVYINIQNTKKLVNIYLGYFDDEKTQIFIEIQSKDDTNKIFEAMQELSPDVLFLIDIYNKSIYFTDESSKKIGVSKNVLNYPQSLIDLDIIHPEDIDIYTVTSADMLDGLQRCCELRVKISTGDYNWFHLVSVIVHDDNDNPIKIIGKLKNIQKEKDIEFKMSHDILTKTLNKISFINCVNEILHASDENENHALYYIGIDNFRYVNEKFDHNFGDELIKNIGHTLTSLTRETDFVGRIGIDQFIIFLPNIDSDDTILKKANFIQSKISKEFTFNNNSYTPKISIGVSKFPLHGKTYNELQKKADIALFNSQNQGSYTATIFNDNN